MLNAEWFADSRVRLSGCLDATLGYYGITADAMRHRVVYRKPESRVLARLLTVCNVPSTVVEAQTGWSSQIVKNDLRVPFTRDQSRLNQAEHQTVSVLLRHVMTAVERDESLLEDPEDEDSRHEWWLLRNAFEKLHEGFMRTPHGHKWWLQHSRLSYHASSHFDLITQKRGEEDKLERERFEENPENDELIWRSIRDFATPVEWQGPFVLLARGYKMALELSAEDACVFEADGRVVLLRGKSAYASASHAPHCLVFPTAWEARGFLRARTHKWRRHAA